MNEKFMTLFSNSGDQPFVVLSAAEAEKSLELAPTEETIDKVRLVEEAFAVAEQNLGAFRAG